ncbi:MULTISPECIES: hypothetical protein [Kitasatospora]|uniref:Uncharacterized protein n=1 Tax=Kitasatospora cathayae TaxID=3004092 RepID=A0ABY7PXL8_9ACTN|nr:hypothetical protein [Kitasatospora sp. HUAS 3-15]WBP84939.1 hypothetical protein O1G21_03130 [Kitasatospora sp. HUAS 3-15]
MTIARRKYDSLKRLSRSAGAVAALAMGASLIAAPQAFADSDPGVANLLNACSWADYCQFHPQSFRTYTGPVHQVSQSLYNCTNANSTQSVNWAETTGSANSVGVSVSASYKFSQVFEASIQATYNHTWETSHTFGETDAVTITPGRVGWIERGTAKQEATGWYEIHFGKRYYGHYIWYIHNYKESGPNANAPRGYVNTQSRPMSAAERRAHCHR